jgi:hypothetical protein
VKGNTELNYFLIVVEVLELCTEILKIQIGLKSKLNANQLDGNLEP